MRETGRLNVPKPVLSSAKPQQLLRGAGSLLLCLLTVPGACCGGYSVAPVNE